MEDDQARWRDRCLLSENPADFGDYSGEDDHAKWRDRCLMSENPADFGDYSTYDDSTYASSFV